MRDPISEVRQYYEANTPSFERFNQSGAGGALHRAVWAPSAHDRQAAFHYVDQLIDAELAALAARFTGPLRVVDFGCGIGASLIWLASRRPILGQGVTLSGVQARRAREEFVAAGLASELECIESNFLTLGAAEPAAHLVFSIEAFVHCPEPREFFAAARRQLIQGGTLVVCDDFWTERAAATHSPRQRRWLREFQHGWLATSNASAGQANLAAQAAGFRPLHSFDLTPQLELDRPRDRLLRLLVGVARHAPLPGYRWRSLVGGNALQQALKHGLLEYRYSAWTCVR